MSIFNTGRPAPQVSPTNVDQAPWWRRRLHEPTPTGVAPVAPGAGLWNASRRSAEQMDVEGHKEGYRQGVLDGRRAAGRRRAHPVLALLFLGSAVAGVGFTAMAFEAGSFQGAGMSVDQKIAEWRSDILRGSPDGAVRSTTTTTQTTTPGV